MKALFKVVLILGFCFALTFVLIKSLNLFTLEDIKIWLENAKNNSSAFLILLVIGLLFMDLFIAVPTLAVSILSGYLLGFGLGFGSALTGLIAVGLVGYAISRRFGPYMISLLLRDASERQQLIQTFSNYGFSMILVCRAIPMLPEVCACIAGMTKMPLSRFMLAWLISTIPYALIASYAGSISSVENPMPAIYAAIALSLVMWIGWFIFSKSTKEKIS